MANLTEESTWEAGIYQIEETDVVRGGPVETGGISNKQAQQLGNRTKYLYDHLGTVGGVTLLTVSADATITSGDLYNKQVMLTLAATGKVLTVDSDSVPDGGFFTLSVIKDTSSVPPACVKLEVDGSTEIVGGSVLSGFKNRIWLYVGDIISFTRVGNTLYVTNLKGNHDAVGEILYKPFQPGDAVAAKGQLVPKANYARLWQFASDNGLTIADATWLSSPARQGLFGVSGASANFRLPDLRGVFLRGLDNGRGLDIDRPYPGEGVYQADQLKSHNHSIPGLGLFAIKHNDGWADISISGTTLALNTNSTGGIETRGKNIAYTTYIRY